MTEWQLVTMLHLKINLHQFITEFIKSDSITQSYAKQGLNDVTATKWIQHEMKSANDTNKLKQKKQQFLFKRLLSFQKKHHKLNADEIDDTNEPDCTFNESKCEETEYEWKQSITMSCSPQGLLIIRIFTDIIYCMHRHLLLFCCLM